MSRPSRARGLKPSLLKSMVLNRRVAPFPGAWIETRSFLRMPFDLKVAPFPGAWIETQYQSVITAVKASRPSRARGLKLKNRKLKRDDI